MAYIPAYTPELSPIEKYFSRLKNIILRKSKLKTLNWQSEEAQKLIKKSILIISRGDVKRLWFKFTNEIRTSVESIHEAI